MQSQPLFPEAYAVPRWESVHFLPDTEYDLDSFRAQLQRMEIIPIEIELTSVETKSQFIELVAHALQFPDFGHNWDALHDFLTDLSWLPAKGYVLLLREARSRWQLQPEIMGTFVEIWLNSAEFWSQRGVPFHAIFFL